MNHDLDADLYSKIAHLRISARSIADSVFAGAHPSRRVGSSVDFAEHREYRPGDDPRTLDSRVYARTDRWVVRRFEHESEIRASLVLDSSGSMQFGSSKSVPTKIEYARRVLLGLAYLMLRQGDRVGAIDLVRGAQSFVAQGGGLAQLDRVRECFDVATKSSVASTTSSLSELAFAAPRRSLVAIASDALDEDGGLAALANLRAAGHLVVFFHVLDPFELELPIDGVHEFVGLENDGRVIADPALIRQAYAREIEAFLERVKAACADSGALYLLARTDEAPERVISDLAMSEALI